MSKDDVEVGMVIIVLLVILLLGISFGVMYGAAWLTVAVALGFGYELPFWPVVGAWGLLAFVAWLFKGRSS